MKALSKMRVSLWAGVLLAGVTGGRAAETDFHQHLGIQLYSMRAMMLAHPDEALATVHGYGITEVETAGTANRTPAQFAAALRANHLRAISAHEGYDRLVNDLPGVIAEARALGVADVYCSALGPSVPPLNEVEARKVAAQLNAWGRALSAAGFHFGLHTHGMEFRPLNDGTKDTAFDVLMRETDPALVSFEMDVYWVRRGGGDPVGLLKKYPGRWTALHLKDMRIGAPIGSFDSRTSPATDRVVIGTGVFDWPVLLRAAAAAGVTHYYIEDETPDPGVNIPASLAYLRNLKL